MVFLLRARRGSLLPCSLPVIFHHFLSDIVRVANWRSATRPTVGAAFTALSTRPVGVVRARTISSVACDGFVNDGLLDFRVGLGGLLGLAPRNCQGKN